MNRTNDENPCLALELGEWTITLQDGSKIQLRVHAYSEEGDDYVFSVLMRGRPAFYIDILRIPRASVAEVTGG